MCHLSELLPWSPKLPISSGDFLSPLQRPPSRWSGLLSALSNDATLMLLFPPHRMREEIDQEIVLTLFSLGYTHEGHLVCTGLSTCWTSLQICGGTDTICSCTRCGACQPFPPNTTLIIWGINVVLGNGSQTLFPGVHLWQQCIYS